MVASRHTIRDKLASDLTTYLTGSGKPVQAVYAYPAANWGTLDPVVTISSMGSERPALTGQGVQSVFYFAVVIWLRHNESEVADTEDRMDNIEEDIAEYVDANRQVAGYWGYLEYSGRSEREYVRLITADGSIYLTEAIPVKVTVYG